MRWPLYHSMTASTSWIVFWLVFIARWSQYLPSKQVLFTVNTRDVSAVWIRKVSLHFPDHGSLNGGSPQVDIFDCWLKGKGCASNCRVFVKYNGVVDATGRARGRRWRYRVGSAAEEAPYPAEDKRSTSFICDKTCDSIDANIEIIKYI